MNDISELVDTLTGKNRYGKRIDGTYKGSGYFGELKTAKDNIMTEYSIGVDFGQGEIEIPTVVPTLTKKELDILLSEEGKIPKEIIDKAVEYAKGRIKRGMSPFAGEEEKKFKLPAE